MKKLLTILIASAFAVTAINAIGGTKPSNAVAQKKVAKKHQRVDGTKVADDKVPTKKK
jgi:hypothetical protein